MKSMGEVVTLIEIPRCLGILLLHEGQKKGDMATRATTRMSAIQEYLGPKTQILLISC